MKPACSASRVCRRRSCCSPALILRHGHTALIAPARAQDASPDVVRPAKAADRKAAIASIQAQLKAFQKNDFVTAVRYQSSGLQAHFGSVTTFQHMMETNYPAFLNFKSATFGPAATPDKGQTLVIPVTLLEGGGVKVQALYEMVREGKTYKVNGVQGGAAPAPEATPSQET